MGIIILACVGGFHFKVCKLEELVQEGKLIFYEREWIRKRQPSRYELHNSSRTSDKGRFEKNIEFVMAQNDSITGINF